MVEWAAFLHLRPRGYQPASAVARHLGGSGSARCGGDGHAGGNGLVGRRGGVARLLDRAVVCRRIGFCSDTFTDKFHHVLTPRVVPVPDIADLPRSRQPTRRKE